MAAILGGAVLRQKDDVLGVRDIHVSALRQFGGWVTGCGVLALAGFCDPGQLSCRDRVTGKGDSSRDTVTR